MTDERVTDQTMSVEDVGLGNTQTLSSIQHDNNRQPSSFIAAPPSLLPRYQVINTDYMQHQVPATNRQIVTGSNDIAERCPHVPPRENLTPMESYRFETNRSVFVSPQYCNSTATESSHGLAVQPACASQSTSGTHLNHETEMNAGSQHDISTSSAGSHNISSVPILNSVSDYIITELPRTTDSSLGHQQMLMMDSSVVSGYNHNESNQPQLPMTAGEMLACMPGDFAQPRPRRGRRDRRRRRRRRHRSRHHHQRSGHHHDDDTYPKPDCCSILACKICLASCFEFKKVLVFFGSFGFICVLIGIVLGVLRSPGNNFFALCLSFVAMGIILLIMVLIGWRCIPLEQQPCHRLFGLGNHCSRTRRNRRRRERYSWLGRRMHPEFRYRPPPPSYASAMQEYRNELRHIDIESIAFTPGSPPPSYKSYTTIERPGIHIIFPRNEEFPTSNPPTYRLRNPTSRPSLAVLHDSAITADNQIVPSRFSVSSTTALVESEETACSPSPPVGGIVNMSFSSQDHTVEIGNDEEEINCNTSSSSTDVRPTTTDGSVQTDDIFQNLPRSVAIILEDDNSSTL